MTDSSKGGVDQFSKASRKQLKGAADALAVALKQHTAALLELNDTSESDALFALNAEVRAAVAAWDDAVFDHAGAFPVAVESDEDDDDEDDLSDEDDLEDEDTGTGSVGPVPVSVVGRWDLVVVDSAALLSAAEAAHRRHNPSVSEADAAAWIGEGGVGQALYAIVHERGEPWFEIPGVEAVAGHRAYLRRDDEEVLEPTDLDYTEPPVAPAGELLFSEAW